MFNSKPRFKIKRQVKHAKNSYGEGAYMVVYDTNSQKHLSRRGIDCVCCELS